MILAGYILTPDLSEFNALHGHEFYPLFSEYSPRRQPVNRSGVTLGDGWLRKPAALLP